MEDLRMIASLGVILAKYARFSEIDGRYQIDCKKGLWGVDAPDKIQAITEAWHYFQQYAQDGEYDEHC